MRIAVQIAGQPRFCSDLTDFIKNFRTGPEDTVDWHLHLWSHNDLPHSVSNPHLILVHESWQNPQEPAVRALFAKNLPEQHKLVTVQFSDPRQYSPPEIPKSKIKCPAEQVWTMWRGWKLVDQQRQEYERTNPHYDLVVKARTDCAFTAPVNIATSDLSGITVAEKPWHGFQRKINDTLAIGSRNQITTYSSVIDHALDYLDAVNFHPETILAYHLEKQGVKIIKGPWSIKFRTWSDPKAQIVDWGDWIL